MVWRAARRTDRLLPRRSPRGVPLPSILLQAQQGGAPAPHLRADPDQDFLDGVGGHEDLGARAELDHAEAVAGPDLLARAKPADDAARDRPRDLLDAHQP